MCVCVCVVTTHTCTHTPALILVLVCCSLFSLSFKLIGIVQVAEAEAAPAPSSAFPFIVIDELRFIDLSTRQLELKSRSCSWSLSRRFVMDASNRKYIANVKFVLTCLAVKVKFFVSLFLSFYFYLSLSFSVFLPPLSIGFRRTTLLILNVFCVNSFVCIH